MNDDLIQAILKSIIDNDKTPEYGYGIKAVNKTGKSPPVGSRWMTPREICKEALEDIEEEAYAQNQA